MLLLSRMLKWANMPDKDNIPLYIALFVLAIGLAVGAVYIPRNSDGNPDSPQAVVFLATIVDVTVGY